MLLAVSRDRCWSLWKRNDDNKGNNILVESNVMVTMTTQNCFHWLHTWTQSHAYTVVLFGLAVGHMIINVLLLLQETRR